MLRLHAVMGWIRIALALVVIAAVVRSAAAAPVPFAIEIVPRGAPAWQADALAAALAADVPDRELALARPGQPAEVVLRGELDERALRYTIGPTGRGVIELAGLGRHELANLLRDELHRVVRPHDGVAPSPPAVVAEPGVGPAALAGLAGLALALIAPLVLARRGVRGGVRRLRAPPRLALGLAALAIVAGGLVAAPARFAELGAAVFVAGGLAWGVLAAVLVPVALPPLPGLHRAGHGELGRALSAWGALAVQRLAGLALVLIPLAWLLDRYAAALALPPELAFGVVAPLAALVVYLAGRATIEVLAHRLDRDLVEGEATAAQPWHRHVRAYLVGYLARANLAIDHAVLERVVFLPGRPGEVAVYGGFRRVRVVIPRTMLEHALAPYGRPHDYLAPRVSTLHWTHWGSGLVMPTDAGDKLASFEDRRPHATTDEGESERLAIGEPPTLTGIIEPVAFDPRTSYRPDEDPRWLDWDPGEEHDGTDPGDRDYLFGILVHALGTAQRREAGRATLALTWTRWAGARRIGRVLARATAPLARRVTRLADVHAALGGARHHLAQYLAWRALDREDLLTARAYVPELEQRSREIAKACASTAGAAPVRRRIAELGIGARPRRPRAVRIALAVAVLGALAGVAALVIQSVRYRATYEARMTDARRERAGEPAR